MNHYDGPAFYRRFVSNARNAKKSAQKRQSNQISQVSHLNENEHHFNRDFKPTDTSENKLMQLTDAFKPATRDYQRKEHVVDRKGRAVNAFYHRLIEELKKSPTDCILMAGQTEMAHQPSIKFDLVDDQNKNNASQSNVKPTKSDTVTSIIGHNEEDDDKQAYQSSTVVNHITSADDRTVAAPSDSLSINDDSSSDQQMSSNDEENVISENKPKSLAISSQENKIQSISQSTSDKNESSGTSLSSGCLASSASDDSVSSLNDISSDEDRSSDNDESVQNNDDEDSKVTLVPDESVSKTDVDDQTLDETDEPILDDSDQEADDHHDHALGHSLDTIIDNEEQQNQNIALFDKPSQVQANQVDKNYQFPQFTLLNAPQRADDSDLDDWILNQSDVLDRTLKAFNVDGEVVDWTNGPTVTRFQVKLKLGVKVSRITNLNDDLKMALAAKDIRIEAPIPGRRTVGVEIPNPKPRPVMLSEVLETSEFKNAQSPLTAALGVDLSGQPKVTDIRKMPHGLIAGATGSGKSVFINSLLISLLYKATPADLRMILIDPKAVEMATYNGIPHLLAPVISEPNEASAALKWAVKEMDERYERLAASGARNIEQYNQQAVDHHQPNLKMPYILIVIDELADLMMVASTEVQEYIVRITQKARAAGIHLIVATQRPSVDIITGTIKNNIPTRVAFMVSSQIDSRTIIDTAGAERLLGKGDMLYLGNGKSQAVRLQGTYVANQEIERITAAVKKQAAPHYAFNPKSLLKRVNAAEKQDDLFPQVLKYIANEKHVSTSKLQRVFSIGYNRAASLIDDLEQHGYVSGQHGSKPREVYLTMDDYKKLNL